MYEYKSGNLAQIHNLIHGQSHYLLFLLYQNASTIPYANKYTNTSTDSNTCKSVFTVQTHNILHGHPHYFPQLNHFRHKYKYRYIQKFKYKDISKCKQKYKYNTITDTSTNLQCQCHYIPEEKFSTSTESEFVFVFVISSRASLINSSLNNSQSPHLLFLSFIFSSAGDRALNHPAAPICEQV